MSARRYATRLAVASAAAGLVIAGLVLLLRALWLVLAAALTPLWAHTILGGSLVVLGGLALWFATRPRPTPAPPLPRDQIVDLVVAFLEGVSAGRNSRHHDR
ncbi:MAG: hypothetical protein KDK10_18820 [Maritimibacter sp.]|nr:hypothetical protein [Maritimibacter sp.]